ncbi:hypothetical protein ACFSTH_07065 [Paenibacillus yanchengensis]|uniref:Uncharacterized protein n=1 Tax=Paenibacillus yanchengensis TaxID=2035833 RepID=A0ABW4YHV1_9BACL
MNLTNKEAYLAMCHFLEGFYERTGSDDVGALLGGMRLIADEETMDSAAWQDWIQSIQLVKKI